MAGMQFSMEHLAVPGRALPKCGSARGHVPRHDTAGFGNTLSRLPFILDSTRIWKQYRSLSKEILSQGRLLFHTHTDTQIHTRVNINHSRCCFERQVSSSVCVVVSCLFKPKKKQGDKLEKSNRKTTARLLRNKTTKK